LEIPETFKKFHDTFICQNTHNGKVVLNTGNNSRFTVNLIHYGKPIVNESGYEENRNISCLSDDPDCELSQLLSHQNLMISHISAQHCPHQNSNG